jgi:hypothetical protein
MAILPTNDDMPSADRRNLWRKNNPSRRKAWRAVENAKRTNKLIPQPCEVCGKKKNIHAHHDDYSKPLKVKWLCLRHHVARHRELREKENG